MRVVPSYRWVLRFSENVGGTYEVRVLTLPHSPDLPLVAVIQALHSERGYLLVSFSPGGSAYLASYRSPS